MHIKREVKLAVTAIAAVIILIWGINFLKARALFDRNNVFYGVYERVDGLKVSSSVIYRGYSVGQVSNIRFIGERFDKVLVEFSVGKKLEIPANTIAVIQSADLMGSKAINLEPGNSPDYAESGDTLKTQLDLGIVEQLNKQLEPLKKKAENIMVALDTLLVSIQELFDEGGNESIKGSLKSVGRTLNNVEQASGSLNRMLAKESVRISEILEHVNSITGNLENNNSKITRSFDNVVAISDSLRAVNLSNTVRQLNDILVQVDSVVVKINRGDGTLGEVVNNDELYYNLTTVSESLNELLIEFKANPKKFVNLSVFDFTSNKTTPENYGIVIAKTEKPLAVDDDLYRRYPDLKQVRRNGSFLYLVATYKNLKQAEKALKEVKKDFEMSYIVNLSQNIK